MASPVLPSDFEAAVPSPSASLCTRFFNLLQLSDLVFQFMDWFLTDDGDISEEALDAFNSPPVGTVVDFAGPAAPAGWLMCDGTAVDRVTYADLFNIIGTTYGSGNGTTTFNVPDTRGRCTIGQGTGSGLSGRALAQTLGAETHTLTQAELPDIDLTVSLSRDIADVAGDAFARSDSNETDWTTTNITVPLGGSDDPHNNMQPSIVFNKIIRF